MRNRLPTIALLLAVIVVMALASIASIGLWFAFPYFFLPHFDRLMFEFSSSLVKDWQFVVPILIVACLIVVIIRKGNWSRTK